MHARNILQLAEMRAKFEHFTSTQHDNFSDVSPLAILPSLMQLFDEYFS